MIARKSGIIFSVCTHGCQISCFLAAESIAVDTPCNGIFAVSRSSHLLPMERSAKPTSTRPHALYILVCVYNLKITACFNASNMRKIDGWSTCA